MSAQTICARHTSYTAGCPGCRERQASWSRERYRRIAYGTWEGLVDAAEAQAHLQGLLRGGMSIRAVAAAAGLSKNVVARLTQPGRAKARPETVSAVLAVVAEIPPNTIVSSLGASRRLRALMAAGWTAETLAPLLNTTSSQVRRWRRRESPTLRYGTHVRVAALYRRLEVVPGPSEMARILARRWGYAGPGHWDDSGDLDAPNGRPKAFHRQVAA